MTLLTKLDGTQIAESMKGDADRLSQVGEFLCGFLGKGLGAEEMYARLLGVQSFLRIDAEEIETGLCSCRHVPAEWMEEDNLPPCQRCGGTGVSAFVRANGETVGETK